jgi:hypothetical protein
MVASLSAQTADNRLNHGAPQSDLQEKENTHPHQPVVVGAFAYRTPNGAATRYHSAEQSGAANAIEWSSFLHRSRAQMLLCRHVEQRDRIP